MNISVTKWFSWVCIGIVPFAVAYTFTQVTMYPLDDHFLYQSFVESVARGNIDLSIRGFHGSDVFAVPWFLLTRSNTAQIEVLMIWAVLLPILAFFSGKTLFKHNEQAILLAGVISMMPFVLFVGLRGWTGPAYFGLMLGAIAAARRNPPLSGILLAFAILTKPFAIVVLPLLLSLQKKRASLLAFALGIPGLYILAQVIQTGGVTVGAHQLDQFSVWDPLKFPINLAHALQILFSVHNYYFPDPGLTGAGNMMHTTPVIIFLGFFALLYPRPNDRLRNALLWGAVAGIIFNALLDHMDHFYMEAPVLLLTVASIPMLHSYPLWIPLALATLHFQWLYFFLQFQDVFSLSHTFFAVPLVVDALFGCWVVLNARHALRPSHIAYDTTRLSVVDHPQKK